jgi:MFS family permease
MTTGTGPAPPRGWYYGWNIVAVCVLAQVAANGLTYNCMTLFLPDWSKQLHAPVSLLQLSIAGMVLVCAPLSPFAGQLADKYPPRWLFGCGLLGMAVFYFAISEATAPWQILALYATIAAVALTVSTAIPANALISRWFIRRLGVALGISAFGIGMAGVILPPIIAAVLPIVGWRMVWRAGAFLLAFVVMPLVVLVIRNHPTEREGLHYLVGDDGSQHLHHSHASSSGQLTWRDIAARRNFWILVAVYLPLLALNGSMALNLAPYALSHGLSRPTAGILISLLSFSHIVATLGLGFLSDRFGNRLPFAGLAVVVALGGVVLAFGAGLPLIALGCVLVGLGGGLYTLLSAAIAVEYGAAGFGRAYGLAMLFLPAGSLSGFVIAKSQETVGSYAPALVGFAVIAFIGGAISLLLRERRGGHLTEEEKEVAMEEAVTPIS